MPASMLFSVLSQRSAARQNIYSFNKISVVYFYWNSIKTSLKLLILLTRELLLYFRSVLIHELIAYYIIESRFNLY